MGLHVRPISDLRNKSLEISKLVHKTKGSVIITRNGREDMVIMSFEQWEDLVVYPLILEAEEEEKRGAPSIPLEEAMDAIDKKFGFGKYAGKRKPESQIKVRRTKRS
jgi:prevent-host-death family protein